MTWFPRLLGAATAAYGAAVLMRPDWLLRPAGLSEEDNPGIGVVARTLAARDLVSGVAMAAAPGPALRTAIAVRVASDAADAVILGRVNVKLAGVAAGWGALCALSALATRRS